MRSFLVPLFCATVITAQRRMSGGYIVELASAPAGKRSADPHAEFLEALDRRAVGNFHTRQEYRSELFNGIAVQLTTPEELVDLASLPNVVAVHPLYIQPGPQPVKKRVMEDGEESPVLGRSVHIMTGVDLVHASGVKGKDIQIAILDSGVDYTHPALGGGFGPGFKIAGGTDLVGDDYTGDNTPVPDDDPMDCVGHGTHVTGIVGANPDNEYHVVGVAPEAKIFMYKVGGCHGGIGDDIITAAIIRATEEGADVISMSFGGADGWSDSAIAVVASRATERGVVVTASAGNDGDAGLVYSSTPAVGENVISVGSVENTAVIKQTFVTNVEHEPFKYLSLASPVLPGAPVPGVPTTPLPVLALMPYPDGTKTEDCSQPDTMPKDIPEDLSGLAIVLYGSDNFECPVFEFVMFRNPAVILNYKNPYLLLGGSNPSVLVSDEDGAWLAAQSTLGNLTVAFPGPPLEDSTGAAGGLMNDFSSMGPGNRLEFYPSLSAPGGDIMSTLPGGQWAAMSGTSMSNPYAAGSAALLLQAKGKGAASSVRALLQSTAQSLPASRADGALPQTLAYQGAGLINVYAALSYRTEISPAQLQLNGSTHWKDTHTLTLSNRGAESQTYTLAHVAAGTTVTKPEDKPDINLDAAPLVSAPADVAFSKETVTIPAGESATIVVTISPPKNADTRTLPIVSGWITATSGASGEVVKASYLGVAAPFDGAQVISTTNRYSRDSPLPNIFGETDWQRGPANYSIRDPSTTPVLFFALSIPSTRVLIDLIDANTDIESNVPHEVGVAKRDFSDWLPAVPGAHRVSASAAAAYPNLGPIGQFNYMVRNARARSVEIPRIRLAEFANGTRIPLGQYKTLVRALRPFGDPEKAEDYDAFVSVQFGWVA
ncbi:subtilisin-like protein [Auricularia subglabra TFB-10046 SS5]|nr:subtilisin-like protein [Auricularia subglabra TFB-10046 SS5]